MYMLTECIAYQHIQNRRRAREANAPYDFHAELEKLDKEGIVFERAGDALLTANKGACMGVCVSVCMCVCVLAYARVCV